ncbi:MAG: hypothetical protein EOM52_08605 [Clostridia bacterium]|nr:hypothetical protein [Clostridia bacterium]
MKEAQGAKRAGEYDSEEGRIQVRVSDFIHGLRIYDGVRLVRIKSKDYTLLIMEDYFPLLGTVLGRVELLTSDGQLDLGDIKGFYLHRDNEFSLLVEEQRMTAEEESHVG